MSLVALLALSGCSGTGEAAAIRQGVGPRHLVVTCGGAGRTTLVFAAGLGDAGTSGWGSLPSRIAGVRWCVYDRPGTGQTPTARGRSIRTDVEDLSAVIADVTRPGHPLVVVGHSLGGLIARTYALEHQKAVAGLVLVDPTPAGWGQRLAKTGLASRLIVSGLNPERIDVRHDALSPTMLDAAASLGRLRVIALISNQSLSYPGISKQERRALEAFRLQEQTGILKSISRRSTVTRVDSGHYVQRDRPELVIAAIRDVVG